jgi:trk system potassium uptake protein TrkH
MSLVVVGGLLLWSPLSQTGGVTLSDALFTSTSAVTVTGLIVVDPGTSFTLFGQVVIAILIQLGGLGLMSFAVLVLLALRIPIGLPQRLILREDLNQSSFSNLTKLVAAILRISLIVEGVGALLLWTVFIPAYGFWPGLWHGIFHSISAFNNAGFALFPDSLMQWVDNPVVNLVISFEFILGGIGFVVLADIWQKRQWNPLMLHTKIMLAGTVVLILWAWLGFAVLEWSNPGTLAGLETTSARLWASWFQAVTPRTAGFNTLDTQAMHESTTLMTMTLMLVGGGSTSTAGGIKVTTLIVLVMATIAFFRRQTMLNIFGRSLGLEEVFKVMALTTISILLVLSGIFIMSISHDGEFLDLAFEVTSAFGTVGMSRGITPELDSIGRTVIMLVMFLGRVGPLTIGFFLATQSVPRVKYPEGQVYLG